MKILSDLSRPGRLLESNSLNDMSEEEQIAYIKKEPSFVIAKIQNPSENVQLAAVEKGPYALLHIKDPCIKAQVAAINKYPTLLTDIDLVKRLTKPAVEECKDVIIKYILTHIIQHGDFGIEIIFRNLKIFKIKWPELDIIRKSLNADKLLEGIYHDYYNRKSINFDLLSKEKQLAYIDTKPILIQYIDNPCEEIQLAAITKKSRTIHFIKHPTEKAQILAVKTLGENLLSIAHEEDITPTVLKKCRTSIIKAMLIARQDNDTTALNIYFRILSDKQITWPEINIIKKSLESDNLNEQKEPPNYSISQSDEQSQIDYVSKNYDGIKLIPNPSEKVQMASILNNTYSLAYIDNPTYNVQKTAVAISGSSIQFVNNPSEELQLLAVEDNPINIQYIKNPTEKVQNITISKNPYIIDIFKNISPSAIEHNKSAILTAILISINTMIEQNATPWAAINIYNTLIKNNIGWPELDIIKKSFENDNLI